MKNYKDPEFWRKDIREWGKAIAKGISKASEKNKKVK